MRKWIGWIIFFVVVIGLAVGGFFLATSFDVDTFQFKEVEILDYDDFTINDLVEQDIICNDKGCKFKDKDVIFTISDVKELGKQDVVLKIEYDGEKFEKTFHVDVVDQKNPEIILSNSAIIVDLNEDIDVSSYITEVKDNYDTLNVEDISIENNVDLKNPGDYEIVYTIKDSSNNEGKAVLKVKVKSKNEVVSSDSDDDTNQEVVNFSWSYEISGLYSEKGSMNQDNHYSSIEKNIEVGWDSTFKIDSSFVGNGNYTIRYVVSKNKITGDILSPIGGGLPVSKTDQFTNQDSSSFVYTFSEEGTYYVLITIMDKDKNTVLEKELILHLSSPSEVKDMKLLTEDFGEYLTIDCEFIGGSEELYFVAILNDSNDPRALSDEIITSDNNEIRLYYTAGYYYEIKGVLVNRNEDIVMSKTLKIQK